MFPAGEYLVGIGFTGAGPYELHIAPGDAAPAAAEVEPNDSQDQATSLSGELAASGDRAGSTSDWYSWTVDAVAAEQPWELLVQGSVGTSPGVRLVGADAVPLFEGAAGSDGVLRVPDIQLPAGTYFLEVAGASEELVPYTVELRPGTAPEDGTDAEPNDRPESAVPVALAEGATTLHGRLATVGPQTDVDGYLVAVDDATAGRQTDIKLFWRGGNSRSLCLLDSTGAELQCADGTGSIAFNDVVLAAGDYRLEVSGAADPDDPYLLRFDVTAAATSGFEAEPNDTAALASALDVTGDHPSGSRAGLPGRRRRVPLDRHGRAAAVGDHRHRSRHLAHRRAGGHRVLGRTQQCRRRCGTAHRHLPAPRRPHVQRHRRQRRLHDRGRTARTPGPGCRARAERRRRPLAAGPAARAAHRTAAAR